MDINPILLLAAVMVASTPVLLAAIGELVVERSGVLNLGVEGMMITGAVFGYIIGHGSGSAIGGFAAAALAGACLSLIFGFLTQFLLTNQTATGLGLTLFGLGLSSLVGQGATATYPVTVPRLPIPLLSDIPSLGPILFNHDAVVYLSILLIVLVWFIMFRTRAGLILRATGENHDAAHALGYPVRLVRMLAIFFGGGCAGLAGAYISLVRVPQWTDGITAGAGWIALAIVVFASWKPFRLLIGAYLFGGVTVLQLNLQADGTLALLDIAIGLLAVAAAVVWLTRSITKKAAAPMDNLLSVIILVLSVVYGLLRLAGMQTIPIEYLSMLPYLATIAVLVGLRASNAPASLGKTFHAST
ncbi:ABC transporter permease [Marivivens donghaensis]|uniref:ABC transporter permease n=1 Tax=Marivivens donghaensis TaxID=1699413 RepID=A0ABX0VTM0_9RHOB|nr:ABC transporter permease [Marivivens donghaensis]NIY71216.1 ABC transporter permease [Marivivens donghaensis]